MQGSSIYCSCLVYARSYIVILPQYSTLRIHSTDSYLFLFICDVRYTSIYIAFMHCPHAAYPSTDPAPLRGSFQVTIPSSAQGPSREEATTSQHPGLTMAHPLSSTPKNVCWPEFPTFQREFAGIISSLSEVLRALDVAQFESLLVYLRERLRPMVDGCFPTGEPANLPRGKVTPLELIQHLQDGHYWDYLNTNLLEDIIGRVTEGDSPLRSQMRKYKATFCSKVTHTLEEC